MTTKVITTFYITKYALTSGIIEGKYEETDDGYASNIGLGGHEFHKIGTDAHRTQADAVKKAKNMRLKKIKSLKEQIAKLEDMRFE